MPVVIIPFVIALRVSRAHSGARNWYRHFSSLNNVLIMCIFLPFWFLPKGKRGREEEGSLASCCTRLTRFTEGAWSDSGDLKKEPVHSHHPRRKAHEPESSSYIARLKLGTDSAYFLRFVQLVQLLLPWYL